VSKAIFVASFGALLTGASLSCAAELPACPSSTEVMAATLSDLPHGWTAIPAGHRLQLSGVRFYSGPPSEGAELKPELLDSKKEGLQQSRWHFGAEASSSRGIWMRCDYAAQAVSMTVRLPENVVQCEDQYEEAGKNAFAFAGISCKTE